MAGACPRPSPERVPPDEKPVSTLRRIRSALRPRGKDEWRRSFISLYHDLRFGIETRFNVKAGELGSDVERCTDYEATDWVSLREILQKISFSQDSSFLDIGCGKGRALLIASHFPFARILGVEIASSLCHQARMNIARYLSRKSVVACRNIIVIEGDGAIFEIPEDVEVVFLSHPFLKAAELEAMLDRIEQSLARRPRHLFILYHWPYGHDVIARRPSMRPLELFFEKYREEYKVYCAQDTVGT